MLPSAMRPKRLAAAAGLALGAALLPAATDLLPERISAVSRQVEEVRGRKFDRPVPATEIDMAEARKLLRAKIDEGFPAPVDEALRSLVVLGLIDETPRLYDHLVDFYASQVVAFYDPEPRRFFVVKDSPGLAAEGLDMSGMAEGLVYSHELMHALQDESMRLDSRTKALKEDSDRGLALQCLLEGEATFVMIKVVLKSLPGAGADAEEQMAPLLTAGSLERGNVPKDVPAYFADQLFFPYSEGTEYVRAAFKKGGWAEIDRLWKNPPESSAEILHGAPYPPPVEGLLPGQRRVAAARTAHLHRHARRMDAALPARPRAAGGRGGEICGRMARRPDRLLRDPRRRHGLSLAHPLRRRARVGALRGRVEAGPREAAGRRNRSRSARRAGRRRGRGDGEGAGALASVQFPTTDSTPSATSTRFFPARLAR